VCLSSWLRNAQLLVLLPVAALMVVMLAFFIATAAIAQSQQGEEMRRNACNHAGAVHVPFGCTE
jgi:hypothetical protein